MFHSFVIEEHRWLIIGYWELIKQPNVSKLRSYTYRMYGILCPFLSPPKLLFYLIIINYFWYSTINNVSRVSSSLTGLLFVCIYLIIFPLSKHSFYLFSELYSYVCDRIASLRTIVFLCSLGLFLMILDVDFEEEGIEKMRSKRNKFILYNVWYFFHYIIIENKLTWKFAMRSKGNKFTRIRCLHYYKINYTKFAVMSKGSEFTL